MSDVLVNFIGGSKACCVILHQRQLVSKLACTWVSVRYENRDESVKEKEWPRMLLCVNKNEDSIINVAEKQDQ